jgi:hypothetical protein
MVSALRSFRLKEPSPDLPIQGHISSMCSCRNNCIDYAGSSCVCLSLQISCDACDKRLQMQTFVRLHRVSDVRLENCDKSVLARPTLWLGYGLKVRAIWVRLSAWSRDPSLLHSIHTSSGIYPFAYPVGVTEATVARAWIWQLHSI